MTYCTPEELRQFTGASPENFRLEKTDEEGLLSLLQTWINQSKGLIDSFCHQNFDTETPPAISNVCLRLASNMVALAVSRRDTPLIKVNDWSIKISSSNVFSEDLKADLRDGGFVLDKSTKSDSIDFLAITGDE